MVRKAESQSASENPMHKDANFGVTGTRSIEKQKPDDGEATRSSGRRKIHRKRTAMTEIKTALSRQQKKENRQPPGGFDDTSLPTRSPGYTIQISFHGAVNLPVADVHALSSDPYIIVQLSTEVPMRHREDSPLCLHTPTTRHNLDPEWNTEWVVANVPASGSKLTARLYDEDPADHDDRLGKR